MRFTSRIGRILGVYATFSLTAVGAAGAATGSGYHTFRQVEGKLRDLAGSSRGRIELMEMGRSAGGQPLYVTRVALRGGTDPDRRPALFLGANIAGHHNSGTEAALHLLETVARSEDADIQALLRSSTLYVAPALNPDAHDALFERPRRARGGNDMDLDLDRDGETGEDPHDDLDGDGRITRMRIPDPTGGWLPHPEDPRVMVRASGERDWIGTHRMTGEGDDDDGDGRFNEDDGGGVQVDSNFAHAFPFPDAEAGPWAGYAPEARAVMDFLLQHRNVAVAVVYGPANNLLEMPRSLGGGGAGASGRFKPEPRIAGFLGLDPDREYTLDEAWELVKDRSMFASGRATKDRLAQMLGAGPATSVAEADQKALESLANDYKERLKEAGLDEKRPVKNYGKGGFTPWLYYHYGALALELDVWGVPKPGKEESEGEEEEEEEPTLTLETLEEMSAEEFVAFGEEAIQEFLEEQGAPSRMSAERLLERAEGGKFDAARLAGMLERMGGGSRGKEEGDDEATRRRREIFSWVDGHAPDRFAPWTPVTLSDGTAAEVGGLDPFLDGAPPREALDPAIQVHTDTVLEMARGLGGLRIVEVTTQDLGGEVWELEATVANRGRFATHTAQARRARVHLPVRLEIEPGSGVELVTGRRAVTSERLEGKTGTLKGSWLLRGRSGGAVKVRVLSDNSGSDARDVTLKKGVSQ